MPALSRFLPPELDTKRPIAVIAGKGRYPALTVERLRLNGIAVRLIAFEGETAESLWESFPPTERARIKVGQLGKMLDALRDMRAAATIMAGQITPRRLFQGMTPDLKAIAILARLPERNAETIFGAIAKEIQTCGLMPLDARAFLDDQLADEGPMTGRSGKPDAQALAHGVQIAKAVAALDIGQGVVVNKGTVIAVEAFEGTDAMLRRAGQLGAKEPLFIKTVKPRQDYRFDVPVFGMTTLDTLQEANIRCVALEAGAVLILDKEQVLAQARQRGIHLCGYTPQPPAAVG